MPTFSLKPICSYLDRNKISLKSLEFCQWSYIILFVVIQLIRHININDCIHYIVCIIIYIYIYYIYIYSTVYIYIQYIELYRDIDIDIDIDIDSDIDISTINLPQVVHSSTPFFAARLPFQRSCRGGLPRQRQENSPGRSHGQA